MPVPSVFTACTFANRTGSCEVQSTCAEREFEWERAVDGAVGCEYLEGRRCCVPPVGGTPVPTAPPPPTVFASCVRERVPGLCLNNNAQCAYLSGVGARGFGCNTSKTSTAPLCCVDADAFANRSMPTPAPTIATCVRKGISGTCVEDDAACGELSGVGEAGHGCPAGGVPLCCVAESVWATRVTPVPPTPVPTQQPTSTPQPTGVPTKSPTAEPTPVPAPYRQPPGADMVTDSDGDDDGPLSELLGNTALLIGIGVGVVVCCIGFALLVCVLRGRGGSGVTTIVVDHGGGGSRGRSRARTRTGTTSRHRAGSTQSTRNIRRGESRQSGLSRGTAMSSSHLSRAGGALANDDDERNAYTTPAHRPAMAPPLTAVPTPQMAAAYTPVFGAPATASGMQSSMVPVAGATYDCNLCGGTYATPADLQTHRSLRHPNAMGGTAAELQRPDAAAQQQMARGGGYHSTPLPGQGMGF